MFKYLRAIGILSILCFSFYVTEKVALFMQKQDPIYESILAVEEDYLVRPVNAVINDSYITPGYEGMKVNVEESFRNMKNFGAFQISELVFDAIVPEVSVQNYQDKIIRKGNPLKQAVSFILSDEKLINYFEEMGIFYAVLTTKNTATKNREYGEKINYEFTNYNEVEKILKNQNDNTDLCYVGKNSTSVCEKNKKILIDSAITLANSNFAKDYKQVSSGDIIYLENNLELNHLKLLLEQIRFKGLSVVSLSNLISESR